MLRLASLLYREKKMKKYFLYILLILVLSINLSADSLILSFFQGSTDNLFQNSYPETDYVSSLRFAADKNFSALSIFTQGNYSYLYENPNLAYYVQDLGLDYVLPVNTKSAFYFSLTGRGAFYQSDYSDFNYTALNALTSFKSYLSQTSILKSSYSLEYKNYRYSLFDFISHSINVSLDKYFQTKTTLKTELNWGYKYFLHPYLTEASSAPEEDCCQEGNYLYSGYGKGYGKGNYSGYQPALFVPASQGVGQGMQNISISGLIAQGIGDKVGLKVSAQKQWSLSGENPFTYIEEFYMVENPTYDRFSWEGYQVGSQLTVLMPWNIQAKLSYTISVKEFPGIESLDWEGVSLGVTRQDKRKQLEARIEKNFPKFSLFLSYSYVDNHSNDLMFDWSGNFISAGVEWNLFFGKRQ